MRPSIAPLILATIGFSGCADQALPTTPVLEQALFNALGGLSVGDAVEYTGFAATEVLVGAPGAGAEFIYVPFHASQSLGSSLQLEVEGANLAPSTARAPAPSRPTSSLSPPVRLPSPELHAQLVERNRRALGMLLPGIRAAARARGAAGARLNLSGSSATVGELVQINTETEGIFCRAIDNRTGRVEAISQHAIIVGDVGNPSDGFTRADFEQIGQLFDTLVHPTVTRYFAEPTDIDSNNRVIIFFTRAVNELTTADTDGFVGGYFYSPDLAPIEQCPASNVGEIFYILAPDPHAEASHIPHSVESVRKQGIATIAHEYEHLINAGRRIYVNDATQLEESWLDEGLAHIAEELIFYAATGLTPRANIRFEDAVRTEAIREALNSYGIQNLARYAEYLENVTRNAPASFNDRLATRGATWAFLRYAADHSGMPDDVFFRGLVNTRKTGFDNLAAALDVPPLERMRQWGVSIYTDDLVETGDSLLQQPSWDFRSLLPALPFVGRFPLDVEELPPNGEVDLSLQATTSGYVRVEAADKTVRLRATSGGASPPSQLQVTVVRTR